MGIVGMGVRSRTQTLGLQRKKPQGRRPETAWQSWGLHPLLCHRPSCPWELLHQLWGQVGLGQMPALLCEQLTFHPRALVSSAIKWA